MKKLFKQPKLSLFLYLVAIITILYAGYNIYAAYQYIETTYVAQYGYTWAEYSSDFILILVQSAESYVFYGIVLFTLGKITCLLDPMYGFPEDFYDEDDYEEEFEEETEEVVEETVE